MSTQVKFNESVFPLERSNQAVDSHEFATSTFKGVSRYPATDAMISVPSKAMLYPAEFQESFDFSPVLTLPPVFLTSPQFRTFLLLLILLLCLG